VRKIFDDEIALWNKPVKKLKEQCVNVILKRNNESPLGYYVQFVNFIIW